ncbi:hypothetical protein XBLMG947_4097 [Xanthomonas bromi]|uniref:Uncharacterized protein n=1 Tax=Xanthomonas bromi TaxID=56449 RepID=A0A1C3NSF2_9XANT|nr:hypothetical protein XbrCFBP1976_20825 [Xanthomonas bromi]SBV53278.1 hypothetical protein XBLMG947_4097 [Xanthomonas bromi]
MCASGLAPIVLARQVQKQLSGQRDEARVIASLDTAAAQLLALGVTVFEVLQARTHRWGRRMTSPPKRTHPLCPRTATESHSTTRQHPCGC